MHVLADGLSTTGIKSDQYCTDCCLYCHLMMLEKKEPDCIAFYVQLTHSRIF